MKNIFVENLPATVSEQALRTIFEAFGQVLSVTIVTDRDTGAPRGLAFVEMNDEAEASRAIAGVHGTTIDGCQVTANEARLKQVDPSTIHTTMRRHREHRY